MVRDFKGVWIPKEIWLHKDLSLVEKCLLIEIDSLDNSPERGCFASNKYFADFFQLSESRIANILTDLKKRGYIKQVYFDGRNRGLRSQHREICFTENGKADLPKKGKQTTRKREHNYTVTVGAGGAGNNNPSITGGNGSDSTFATVTSTGGGGGGGYVSAGAVGGSGGGAGRHGSDRAGGAGTANQGFAGAGSSVSGGTTGMEVGALHQQGR